MILDTSTHFRSFSLVGTNTFYFNDVYQFNTTGDWLANLDQFTEMLFRVTTTIEGTDCRLQFGIAYSNDTTLTLMYTPILSGGAATVPFVTPTIQAGTEFRVPVASSNFFLTAGLGNPGGAYRYLAPVVFNARRAYGGGVQDCTAGAVEAYLVQNPTSIVRHYPDATD